mmetsp:Transcript_4499/g.6733  ORF Transcript_4499/g.6733 Transcript_4499/m.6733 type:complete len:471 (+) Transcript_4499:1257-2669(+)
MTYRGPDCSKCLAYNPNVNMEGTRESLGSRQRYGELKWLGYHSCADNEKWHTDLCCEFVENDDHGSNCKLKDVDHPCVFCDGLVLNDFTLPSESVCGSCSMYYPGSGITGEKRGKASPLTRHACAFHTGDTSNCCLYDGVSQQCGVYDSDNNSFLYPCTSCNGNGNKSTTTSILIVIPLIFVGLVVTAFLYFPKRRHRKKQEEKKTNPAAIELPHATPIDHDEHSIVIATPVPDQQTTFAEVVDVEGNDPLFSASPMACLDNPLPSAPPKSVPLKSNSEEAQMTSGNTIPNAVDESSSKPAGRNHIATYDHNHHIGKEETLKPWSISLPQKFPLEVTPSDTLHIQYIEDGKSKGALTLFNPDDEKYYAIELRPSTNHYTFEPQMTIVAPKEYQSCIAFYNNREKEFLDMTQVKLQILACPVDAASGKNFLIMLSSLTNDESYKVANEEMWKEVLKTKVDVIKTVIDIDHI